MRTLIATLALLVVACATDEGMPPPDDGTCRTSNLDYASFGAPFMSRWCLSCHSSTVSGAARHGAPTSVNFDTEDEVLAFSHKILGLATGTTPSMPPGGGPSPDERAQLAEWLECQ